MFRSRFDGQQKEVSRSTGVVMRSRGVTKQSFRDECDINNIMKKFEKGQMVNHVNKHRGSYGDFDVVDYQSAMNTIISAQESFASLPAKVRARFNNDPAGFLEFVGNPDNRDEMVKLGLIVGEKAPAAPSAAVAAATKEPNTPPVE